MTEIISRKSWGARYEAGFRDAPLPAERLYLHHSVTVAPDLVPPFLDDDAAIRTLERIGQNRFGGGISYTFAITPVGRIYEGHGVGRQGAHTAGLNSTARAICWVGNYDVAHPPQPMVDATVWLVRHGHAQGWWRQPRFTGGHKDAPAASTACPGRHAYALIGEMNLLAAAPPEEDEMTPEQLDTILRHIDLQVGFARDQTLTRFGVHNPGAYPDSLTPEELAAIEPARRVDVESALEQITAQLAELTALVRTAGVDPAVVTAAITEALGGGLTITGTAVPANTSTEEGSR